MKEYLKQMVEGLVSRPDEIKIVELANDGKVTLQLVVADEDKGRVIGKEGNVAEAMRTLLRVVATRHGKRVKLEII